MSCAASVERISRSRHRSGCPLAGTRLNGTSIEPPRSSSRPSGACVPCCRRERWSASHDCNREHATRRACSHCSAPASRGRAAGDVRRSRGRRGHGARPWRLGEVRGSRRSRTHRGVPLPGLGLSPHARGCGPGRRLARGPAGRRVHALRGRAPRAASSTRRPRKWAACWSSRTRRGPCWRRWLGYNRGHSWPFH